MALTVCIFYNQSCTSGIPLQGYMSQQHFESSWHCNEILHLSRLPPGLPLVTLNVSPLEGDLKLAACCSARQPIGGGKHCEDCRQRCLPTVHEGNVVGELVTCGCDGEDGCNVVTGRLWRRASARIDAAATATGSKPGLPDAQSEAGKAKQGVQKKS